MRSSGAANPRSRQPRPLRLRPRPTGWQRSEELDEARRASSRGRCQSGGRTQCQAAGDEPKAGRAGIARRRLGHFSVGWPVGLKQSQPRPDDEARPLPPRSPSRLASARASCLRHAGSANNPPHSKRMEASPAWRLDLIGDACVEPGLLSISLLRPDGLSACLAVAIPFPPTRARSLLNEQDIPLFALSGLLPRVSMK